MDGEKLLDQLEKIGAEVDDALARFMDDEEMYLKYITEFPEEPTMGKLRKAVDEKNYEQAEKSVHALKGIVLNLGFVPFSDAAIDMLEELRDQNIEEALEAYEEVKTEYEKFCQMICTYRK